METRHEAYTRADRGERRRPISAVIETHFARFSVGDSRGREKYFSLLATQHP
jgi:hypothetical protein